MTTVAQPQPAVLQDTTARRNNPRRPLSFIKTSPVRIVSSLVSPTRRQTRRVVSEPDSLRRPTEGQQTALTAQRSPSDSNPTETRSQPHSQPQSKPPPSVNSTRSLTFAGVADLFVKLRRVQSKAQSNSSQKDKQKQNAHLVECDSGSDVITHTSMYSTDHTLPPRRARVQLTEVFMCASGVDVGHLLRACRNSLLHQAGMVNANALVEEQWTCAISCPKTKHEGVFRVQIHYTASAVHTHLQDPKQPVAVSRAQRIPGLMRVISRESKRLDVNVFQHQQESSSATASANGAITTPA